MLSASIFRLLIVFQFLQNLYWSFWAPDAIEAQAQLNRMAGYHTIDFDDAQPAELLAVLVPLSGLLITWSSALVLLFRFSPAGRYLFLLATALSLDLAPVFGFTITRPFENIMSILTDMTVGALIAMMFTGAVAARFVRSASPATSIAIV